MEKKESPNSSHRLMKWDFDGGDDVMDLDTFWTVPHVSGHLLTAPDCEESDGDGSPAASSSLSPVDTITSSELRATGLSEGSFRPSPPPFPRREVPLYRRKLTPLPVSSAQLNRADTEAADLWWPDCTAERTIEGIVGKLQNLRHKILSAPRPPAEPPKTVQQPGSLGSTKPSRYNSESRIQEIQRVERAKSAALSKQAEKLYSAQQARTEAVLQRLQLSNQDELKAEPLPRRRVSRLPVLSAHHSRADAKVAIETLERLKVKILDSPRPPKSPKRTPSVFPRRSPAMAQEETPVEAALLPTPPTAPQPKKGATRPFRAVRGTGKKATSDCSTPTAKPEKVKLQPLTKPVASLSSSFELLSSDDWMDKISGLKIIQALAQHHPETLTQTETKLHEVCLAVAEEVNNLRSAVAGEAMDTVAALYEGLQTIMDPEVELTGRALLLKMAQTTTTFIQQQANLALDAMVENCSHGRVVTALLNTALRSKCVAVRGSMARHLHQVADNLGAAHILTSGRTFTQRFLVAVSRMCEDGATEVRHHGVIILEQLAAHKDFLEQWNKLVPESDRPSLSKLLKRAKL